MTTRSPKTKFEWETERRLQERAADTASELLEALGIDQPPVDPLALVASEGSLLTARGEDFGDEFDGQLEFHPNHERFILFFNTKYDHGESAHRPRTRFSIAHELGHFYLPKHHAYLRAGGTEHGSRSESWPSHSAIEREADAFAAGLLMPKHLMRPLVNEGELSLDRIEAFADTFQTSLLSTTIRAVQLSDFPCAVIGIREGSVAWRFQTQSLIDATCYPSPKGAPRSESADERWKALVAGDSSRHVVDGPLDAWFDVYRDDLEQVLLTEHHLPVPVMETLVILLTMSEDDLICG